MILFDASKTLRWEPQQEPGAPGPDPENPHDQGEEGRVFSSPLFTCLCISCCLHCNPHITHQFGIYAVEMTPSFLLIWKTCHYLYVPQYPQKRFSAVGCLEIKLHREGEGAERHFFLPSLNFFHHFSIFHC